MKQESAKILAEDTLQSCINWTKVLK